MKQTQTFEENIIRTEYSEVMQKSYIDYAMSVIVARALPDVRDGLKPVQRRTLYDMHELGIKYDKPYRKSARIVGDTMGKYHPHGDSSIYDALVVLTQDFKKGIPLMDGHGNFGNIEGDSAAAMRYTEARLHKITQEAFLADLDKDVVDFIPNFDETEKEPSVLPVKIPNLLINGAEGIAVGMVTSIPPHNLTEVIDATKAYMNNPDITTKELMKYVKGPDFPTGGIVINQDDLLEIYETGVGKVKIRGKVDVEKGKGGHINLVISEIPYTMIGANISKFLQDVAALYETKKTTDIVDIRTLAVAAEGAEFDAIFTVTAFTVNYFVYEESEHGPAGTPAPGYIVYADAEGNAITGTYSLGDAIAHPAAPEIEFYTFAGWVDAEGNEWAEGTEMPAEEVNLYATYERVAVKLVAQEGSTTVVTRGTDTATYKDFFLTGFALRPSITQAVLESTYVDIVGDGTITVKPVGSNRNLGTGAIVTLTDNVTGEVAEQFYVVIYGDLDGNGRINAADSTILISEAAKPVWSVRNSPNRVEYLVKAADLDGNRRINASDSNLLIGVAASKYTINQQTGKAS